MSAPEKPCGRCIHYRRSKKGFELNRRTNQMALEGMFNLSRAPRWFGACAKNNWYVSAKMSAVDGCGWETADDLSMQWEVNDE